MPFSAQKFARVSLVKPVCTTFLSCRKDHHFRKLSKPESAEVSACHFGIYQLNRYICHCQPAPLLVRFFRSLLLHNMRRLLQTAFRIRHSPPLLTSGRLLQVNVAFGGRRKMLRNSLQASQHDPGAISNALEELGLDVRVGVPLHRSGLLPVHSGQLVQPMTLDVLSF